MYLNPTWTTSRIIGLLDQPQVNHRLKNKIILLLNNILTIKNRVFCKNDSKLKVNNSKSTTKLTHDSFWKIHIPYSPQNF